MSQDYIYIGKCMAAHGIKGGFRFLLENTEDSILENGFTVYLQKENQKDYSKHVIKTINFGNRTIVYLDGIADRNIVEKMVPFKIYVDRNDFPEDDGEIYLSDLIGMDVVDFESKIKLGKVKKTYSNGIQDIIVYKKGSKTFELPLIDQFFPEIDMEENCLYVKEPKFV